MDPDTSTCGHNIIDLAWATSELVIKEVDTQMDRSLYTSFDHQTFLIKISLSQGARSDRPSHFFCLDTMDEKVFNQTLKAY
ncbi:hypothetical protein GX48_08370, partial [Paracoccidioides brasiliensis]